MSKDNKDFFKKKNDWSEIKDRLLAGYLPQYFQKLLASYHPIFYIDCFAGKGKFDDGNDGSPRIALKIRNDCLARTTVDKGKIDTCFIDLNYANELQENIREFHHNGKPTIISGKYEEQIENVLSDKKGQNVFLYIDPYGIKALDFNLFKKYPNLGFYSVEMLINMNSFGFFRDACRVMRVDRINKDNIFSDLDEIIIEYEPTEVDASEQSEVLLNNIAGGTYWKAIVQDYQNGIIDGYEAEKRFSTEYKKQLRQIYKYVLDMPIRMKPNQRPKYRMIHVSNHEDGCILMANNMASRKDELFIDIQNKGQLELDMFTQTVENEAINQDEIDKKVHNFIEKLQDETTINTLLASFFTEYGVLCKTGDITNILGVMEENRRIEVIRNPPVTKTGKASTFFSEGKGQSVTIRRVKV
jgi:three-Cys-motif partner protein